MKTIQGLKFRWNLHEVSREAVADLAAANYLTMPIAHALFARGYTSSELLKQLLAPDSSVHVASPKLLKSCDIAVARILQAIEKDEKILVFGDYDVDGITSVSLMLLALLPLNAKINFFRRTIAEPNFSNIITLSLITCKYWVDLYSNEHR